MQLTKERKLILLEILFAVLMVVSNVVNKKVLDIHSILLPGSAFIYIITFFISNVISESWGEDEAKICLVQGIACNVIATIVYILVRFLPAQNSIVQEAYVILLGTNWVFVAADVTACIIAQLSQIFVFNRLREIVKGSTGNLVSMLLSQIIDTAIFLGIGYGLGLMWLADSVGRVMLFNMFVSQYIIKVAIALILTGLLSQLAFSDEIRSSKEETNE